MKRLLSVLSILFFVSFVSGCSWSSLTVMDDDKANEIRAKGAKLARVLHSLPELEVRSGPLNSETLKPVQA